jgi:hypothetical protein
LYSKIEGRLTTEGKEDTIRPLALNNVCDIFWCNWEVVDLIGKDVGGLDGSDIRVDKDRPDASLLESLESLGTCKL